MVTVESRADELQEFMIAEFRELFPKHQPQIKRKVWEAPPPLPPKCHHESFTRYDGLEYTLAINEMNYPAEWDVEEQDEPDETTEKTLPEMSLAA